MRRRRPIPPAAPAIAVLLTAIAVFAVAPSIVASSAADTPPRDVRVEPVTTAPRTDAGRGAVADRDQGARRGVELLGAVQHVCRGMPVDPRVETTVVDCDG